MRSVAVLLIMCLLAACGAPNPAYDPNRHIVRSGETLFSIAWRYGKDPQDVARWNNLGDGSLIHPGDVIYLTPGRAPAASQRSSASRPAPKALPKVGWSNRIWLQGLSSSHSEGLHLDFIQKDEVIWLTRYVQPLSRFIDHADRDHVGCRRQIRRQVDCQLIHIVQRRFPANGWDPSRIVILHARPALL